jgi:hypothetical protein
MRSEIYTCDRCGHSQGTDGRHGPDARKMQTLTLVVEDGWYARQNIYSHNDMASRNAVKSVLWCEVCCAAVGIDKLKYPPKLPEEAPAPTFEYAVRELIREEIEASRP